MNVISKPDSGKPTHSTVSPLQEPADLFLNWVVHSPFYGNVVLSATRAHRSPVIYCIYPGQSKVLSSLWLLLLWRPRPGSRPPARLSAPTSRCSPAPSWPAGADVRLVFELEILGFVQGGKQTQKAQALLWGHDILIKKKSILVIFRFSDLVGPNHFALKSTILLHKISNTWLNSIWFGWLVLVCFD